jgi:hypothetical protein
MAKAAKNTHTHTRTWLCGKEENTIGANYSSHADTSFPLPPIPIPSKANQQGLQRFDNSATLGCSPPPAVLSHSILLESHGQVTVTRHHPALRGHIVEQGVVEAAEKAAGWRYREGKRERVKRES